MKRYVRYNILILIKYIFLDIGITIRILIPIVSHRIPWPQYFSSEYILFDNKSLAHMRV